MEVVPILDEVELNIKLNFESNQSKHDDLTP